MQILFVLFIVVPIAEMAVLITVGQFIGALATIAMVFLTAAIGYALLKQQGAGALQRAKEKMARGETPATEMAEGLFLAVGGVLLLTPGFITDAVGFFCLIPGLRAILVAWGMKHLLVAGAMPPAANDSKATIEGEFRREK